jgi:hypothetical protein
LISNACEALLGSHYFLTPAFPCGFGSWRDAEKETRDGRREKRGKGVEGMMGDKKKAVGVRGSSLRCNAEVLKLERRFESGVTRGVACGVRSGQVRSGQELCVAW